MRSASPKLTAVLILCGLSVCAPGRVSLCFVAPVAEIYCPRPPLPPTSSVVLRRSLQLERLHEYVVPRRSSQKF